MGCNGSKHDAAAGNAIKYRILRRKSDVAVSKTLDAVQEKLLDKPETKSIDDAIEPEKVKQPADGKGIIVNTEGKDEAIEDPVKMVDDHEQEKLVSAESPNHYFSPKKGEESAEAATAASGEGDASEYNSPRSDGGKKEEGPLKVVQSKEGEKIDVKDGGGLADGVGEEAKAAAQAKAKDEKKNDKGSPHLKQPILVEETKVELTGENKASQVTEIIEEKHESSTKEL